MPRRSSLPCAILVVNTSVSMVAISFMSRWLPKDLSTLPLSAIEAEIISIEKTPLRGRSVADTERLADLREAQRRITSGGRRGCLIRSEYTCSW